MSTPNPTHTDLSGFGVYIDERRRVGSTDNWYEKVYTGKW